MKLLAWLRRNKTIALSACGISSIAYISWLFVEKARIEEPLQVAGNNILRAFEESNSKTLLRYVHTDEQRELKLDTQSISWYLKWWRKHFAEITGQMEPIFEVSPSGHTAAMTAQFTTANGGIVSMGWSLDKTPDGPKCYLIPSTIFADISQGNRPGNPFAPDARIKHWRRIMELIHNEGVSLRSHSIIGTVSLVDGTPPNSRVTTWDNWSAFAAQRLERLQNENRANLED